MKIIKINKGDRYGNLTIIREVEPAYLPNGHKKRQVLCKCDCGNEIVAVFHYIRKGSKSSCGCLRGKDGTHHQTQTRLYKSWASMKGRCMQENNEHYFLYGGRGITVCDEWLNFEPFYEWAINNGYTDELTIDRIDVNGNYCPENCRWVDIKTQANNKRNNRLISYHGITKTLAEWSEIKNIPYSVLQFRLKRKWSIDKLLSPVRSQKPNKPFKTDKYKEEIITLFKEGITKTEIGKRLHFGRNAIHNALKRWSII